MANINNLFELIAQKQITAKKLSDDTGISTGNISDWKNGRSMPSAEKLEILSNYFECSIDYLLGREKYNKEKMPHNTAIHKPKKRTYSHYLPSKHIIAFIDVLGTANHPELFPVLYKLYDEIYPYLSLNSLNYFTKRNGYIRYMSFSDNTVLAFSLSNDIDAQSAVKELINIIAVYQANVLKKYKILLRGGISIGDVFIDEGINFIGGSGLIDSVKAESKQAVFPRVIVDDSIISLLGNEIENSCLFKDNDGKYFINYLKHWEFKAIFPAANKIIEYKHDDHLKIINEKIVNEQDNRILEKLYWVKKYHERFIKENHTEPELREIAAWGAEETEGTYIPPVEETT